MREYTAIDDQSSYDLAVQLFGTINDLDKVLRQVEDLNGVTEFGQEMVFDNTDNNLADRFGANNVLIASGNESEIAALYPVFDETFDETFN